MDMKVYNNKKKLNRLVFALFGITIFFLPYCVNAASVNIKSSSSSIVTGNKATITVTISDEKPLFFIEGKLNCSGAGVNGGIDLNLDNLDQSVTSKSFSYTINPNTTGTVTCKTSGVRFTGGSSSSWISLSNKSITIDVVKPREKSTNNNLKNLGVEGYTLSPEFNKNTLEYTVNLESNVEKINIYAEKEDGYASINGTGEKEVQEGDNKFEITVTSETGSSKVYTINAIVQDSNPIEKKIDNKTYTVIKRESALTQPDSFESTTVTIKETEIPAFYNETTDITLIGLKDEEGNIYLYQYDASTDTYTKYETLTSISKTIIFENTDEEIEGFMKTTVKIENQEYTAYQHEKNKDYLLVYGTDLETGKKNWYLYHIKEKTVQVYMNDMLDNMQVDFDNTINEYKLVLLGMAGLSLLLLFITIIEICSKSKMKKKYLQTVQKLEQEKDNKKVEPKKDKVKEKKDNQKKEEPKEKEDEEEELWKL